MSELTKGRRRACKNGVGGIRSLFLMAYVEYDEKSIRGSKNGLITRFPDSVYYVWEGEDITFNETMIDDGSYEQEIKIKVIKKELEALRDIMDLTGIRVRVIVESRLGTFKIAGLKGGLEVDVYGDSGSIKESFQGYDIRFKGIEEYESPFIENLVAAGFIDIDLISLDCLLSSSSTLSSNSQSVSSCSSIDIGEFREYIKYLSSTTLQSSSSENTSKFA